MSVDLMGDDCLLRKKILNKSKRTAFNNFFSVWFLHFGEMTSAVKIEKNVKIRKVEEEYFCEL